MAAIVAKPESTEEKDWLMAISQSFSSVDSGFATMAANCLDLLQRWNLDSADSVDNGTSANKFKAWAREYQSILSKNKLVTAPQSWQLVAQGFAADALPKEPQISLYGFQSISPLQQACCKGEID